MKKILCMTAALCALAHPLYAAKNAPAPTAKSAGNAGHWVVRARALGVLPSEDVTITGAVTGSQIDIDNSIVPEVDVSYFVTDQVAFELIAAVTPHEASTKTSSSGALNLGDVWLLPPTLTAQYHFTDLGACKPYVGAGINYTHFFGANRGTSVTRAFLI